MPNEWDLTILYKGFDDPALADDLKTADELIAAQIDLAARAENLPHRYLLKD